MKYGERLLEDYRNIGKEMQSVCNEMCMKTAQAAEGFHIMTGCHIKGLCC